MPSNAVYVVRMRNTPDRPRGTWAGYIKALREATGLSRAEFARRLDVDPTTVWRWETGRQKPENPAVPQALAKLFRLDLDETLTAAGLRPDAQPPPEPTRERDVELEMIRSSRLTDEQKRELIRHVLVRRSRDEKARVEDLKMLIKAAERRR